MSDIFISYASSDRARVQVLAEALEQRGWSVWWDRDIPPGKTFDQVIEEALDASKCVIVVWSKNSVQSEWVKTEAAEGARRKTLVPVLIDDVKIPLEFRRIQAAWLVDWQGMLSHPELEQLSEAVAKILGHSPHSVLTSIQEQGSEDKKQAKSERSEQNHRERAEEEGEAQAKRIIPEKEYKRQEQIDKLYGQALELFTVQQWRQVLGKMREIQALDPRFADPKGIAARAQEELKKEAERLEQDRREREAREKTAREETERKAREERKRQEQIARLYEQACLALVLQQWSQALEKMREIQALDPEFSDPKEIVARAQEELAREAERKIQEEVSQIRQSMLFTPSLFDLQRLMHKAEELLSKYPYHPEVRLLKDRIVQAIEDDRLTVGASVTEAERLNKGTPVAGQLRKWPKIAAGAGVIMVIIAAIIVSGEVAFNVTVPFPKIENFKAIPEIIEKGKSSTLSWETSNAKEVEISGIGSVSLSGSEIVSPEKTTTYTLIAKNEEGEIDKREITVEVTIPPLEIVSFGGDSPIYRGESSILKWETLNAKEVEISPDIGSSALSDSKTVSPTETTTYTLIARNEEGEEAREEFTVEIEIQPPRILKFSADRSSIKRGESSTLNWQTSNAEEVEISDIGSVPLSGSRMVNPAETTTYTLIVRNEEGKTVESDPVTVEVTETPPLEILNFTAKPSTIEKGGSSTLEWQTSNAKEVEISGIGSVFLSGTEVVSPEKTTTYTLIVRNEEGKTVERPVTVQVADLPPKEREITQLLEKGHAYFERQWFTTPERTNAFEVYKEVLKIDPLNRHAQEKIREMASKYKNWGDGAYREGNYSRAETFYQKYLLIMPEDSKVVGLLEELKSAPRIEDFKAIPETIEKGDSSTLDWNTKNAKEVEIVGIGKVELSGIVTVRPEETTTYTLIARNGEGGKDRERATIRVRPSIPLPEIISFMADRPSIRIGELSTLSWRTSNAGQVFLGEEKVEASSSRMVYPEKTTTYTLIARNVESQTVTKDVKIEVEALPRIRSVVLTDNENSKNEKHIFPPNTEWIYITLILDDIPADALLKAAWIAENIENVEENSKLFEQRQGALVRNTFSLRQRPNWLPGEYRVELYLDERLVHTAPFRIVR